MKKLISILLFAPILVQAQTWNLGGNGITPPQLPILGTNNNFPLRIRTNSTQRMHINESGTTFQGVNTGGYIGIGANPTDVRSRLTITGTNNTTFAGNGYRAWMKTGVLSLENSDNLYVGLKDESIGCTFAIIGNHIGT